MNPAALKISPCPVESAAFAHAALPKFEVRDDINDTMSAKTKRSIGTHVSPVEGIHRTTLPSGLRIISEDVNQARSFALGVWIDAGTRDEDVDQAGIAHFIEHAVFRRSATRSSKQIAAQFESLGAYINAFTSKEQTCYYVRALTPHFERCLNLLIDVVCHPLFRESDIEKERSVILEELKSYEDEAEEYILDIGEKSLFGTHAIGFPIAGNQESVSSISVKQLREFHRRFYSPGNMVIAVAGSMPHEEVVQFVSRLFSRSRSQTTIVKRSAPRTQKVKRRVLERSFQQSHILFAQKVCGIQHPHRWALSLLNTILGDGMSSRLHQRIRERYGIAYSLYSSLQLMTDCGVMSIYAGTETSTLSRTEKLIEHELQELYSKGVTKAELQRSKEQLKSSIIMGLESMSARMHSLAKAELEEAKLEDVQKTLATIDAIPLSELQELCRLYCSPSAWSRVIIKATNETPVLES